MAGTCLTANCAGTASGEGDEPFLCGPCQWNIDQQIMLCLDALTGQPGEVPPALSDERSYT